MLLPTHQPIAETIGDGVDANDVSFNTQFPYVAYPHSGSDADPPLTERRGPADRPGPDLPTTRRCEG